MPKITIYVDEGDSAILNSFVAVVERIARLVGLTNVETMVEDD